MFKHITKAEIANEKIAALTQYLGVDVIAHGDGVMEVVKCAPESGDYTDPILWVDGTAVQRGYWYYLTDKDLPHEAISDGIPTGFYDRDFFDFVEEVEPQNE